SAVGLGIGLSLRTHWQHTSEQAANKPVNTPAVQMPKVVIDDSEPGASSAENGKRAKSETRKEPEKPPEQPPEKPVEKPLPPVATPPPAATPTPSPAPTTPPVPPANNVDRASDFTD